MTSTELKCQLVDEEVQVHLPITELALDAIVRHNHIEIVAKGVCCFTGVSQKSMLQCMQERNKLFDTTMSIVNATNITPCQDVDQLKARRASHSDPAGARSLQRGVRALTAASAAATAAAACAAAAVDHDGAELAVDGVHLVVHPVQTPLHYKQSDVADISCKVGMPAAVPCLTGACACQHGAAHQRCFVRSTKKAVHNQMSGSSPFRAVSSAERLAWPVISMHR